MVGYEAALVIAVRRGQIPYSVLDQDDRLIAHFSELAFEDSDSEVLYSGECYIRPDALRLM